MIRCRKTDRIIYADGNPQNLDRDNLIKLSGAEYITYTIYAVTDRKRERRSGCLAGCYHAGKDPDGAKG